MGIAFYAIVLDMSYKLCGHILNLLEDANLQIHYSRLDMTEILSIEVPESAFWKQEERKKS